MFLISNTVPVSFLHRLVENCASSVLWEWILEVREVISEMKICCIHFEKWKVKWKSDSLFSRSEKWNENASRSRSRSEISREFSRNSRESRKFLDFVKYIHYKCCIWVLYITQLLHITCIISLFFLEKKEWNLKCFHSFREMKSEMIFGFTLFEKWKWN